ncbi:MAG TPA: ornithine carbamoyltransferase [Phycisphaerae bacterium]|nr:ornithine carbamoyltransferase [Phycisphaerae bacterium]
MKDFIHIGDFTPAQLKALLARAIADKALFRQGRLPATCPRKTLALVFEKPSLRTRVSFEAAIVQLGGAAIYLTDADIGLGRREPVCDVAEVLGRMADCVTARTFSHESVVALAATARVPVVNALTDYSHPCQAMADAMTAMEAFGEDLAGIKWAFVGDGNNVARSLAVLSAKLGMHFALACPEGYELSEEFVAALPAGGGSFVQTADPRSAVADAAVVYTDTWVSMGQEAEKAKRVKDFEGFQVNDDLMSAAAADAVVMHCLPAYRGCEISEEVMHAHSGTIFAEAENRLHFQRSLINVLIAEGGIQ